MDSAILEEILTSFESIQCPYTQGVDASYLSELLLVPSQHRLQLLSWLLSCIDPDIERMIDGYRSHQVTFASGPDIDGQIKLLTRIAAMLGLSSSVDFDLIRGAAPKPKHFAFWKNLLAIVSTIEEHKQGDLNNHVEVTNDNMATILYTCDIAAALSSSAKLLPLAIEKELNLSLKTFKSSSSQSALPTVDELNEKLKVLQTELKKQLKLLEDVKGNHPYPDLTADDPSVVSKVDRSLMLALSDLEQLQTSYLQTFENDFRPYCDKSPLKFSSLGNTISKVDQLLSSFLQMMENMKKMRTAHQEITSAKSPMTPGSESFG